MTLFVRSEVCDAEGSGTWAETMNCSFKTSFFYVRHPIEMVVDLQALPAHESLGSGRDHSHRLKAAQ